MPQKQGIHPGPNTTYSSTYKGKSGPLSDKPMSNDAYMQEAASRIRRKLDKASDKKAMSGATTPINVQEVEKKSIPKKKPGNFS